VQLLWFVLLEARRALYARATGPASLPAWSRRQGRDPRPSGWPLAVVDLKRELSTERRQVSPIPFTCHQCGADFTLTTKALALIEYDLDCPECGSPAVQADLLYPLGQGPRLIEELEAEAS
jgi:hypothetical protein